MPLKFSFLWLCKRMFLLLGVMCQQNSNNNKNNVHIYVCIYKNVYLYLIYIYKQIHTYTDRESKCDKILIIREPR